MVLPPKNRLIDRLTFYTNKKIIPTVFVTFSFVQKTCKTKLDIKTSYEICRF